MFVSVQVCGIARNGSPSDEHETDEFSSPAPCQVVQKEIRRSSGIGNKGVGQRMRCESAREQEVKIEAKKTKMQSASDTMERVTKSPLNQGAHATDNTRSFLMDLRRRSSRDIKPSVKLRSPQLLYRQTHAKQQCTSAAGKASRAGRRLVELETGKIKIGGKSDQRNMTFATEKRNTNITVSSNSSMEKLNGFAARIVSPNRMPWSSGSLGSTINSLKGGFFSKVGAKCNDSIFPTSPISYPQAFSSNDNTPTFKRRNSIQMNKSHSCRELYPENRKLPSMKENLESKSQSLKNGNTSILGDRKRKWNDQQAQTNILTPVTRSKKSTGNENLITKSPLNATKYREPVVTPRKLGKDMLSTEQNSQCSELNEQNVLLTPPVEDCEPAPQSEPASETDSPNWKDPRHRATAGSKTPERPENIHLNPYIKDEDLDVDNDVQLARRGQINSLLYDQPEGQVMIHQDSMKPIRDWIIESLCNPTSEAASKCILRPSLQKATDFLTKNIGMAPAELDQFE